MATYKTHGIVIKRHNLGEADRIISFLTPELGVIRAVAKGVRRIKSRMAGHLELFSEVELMLAKGRNLDVVTSARLQHHSGHVTTDYERLQIAYVIAEMIDKLSGEYENHEGSYLVTKAAYEALDMPEVNGGVVELWFKLRLLDSLGYKPGLDGCVICGVSSPDKQYAFNNDLGGIVCRECKTETSAPLTHDQIKLWRLALSHGISSLQKVADASGLSAQSMPVLNQFYEYTFGRTFRSQEMLA